MVNWILCSIFAWHQWSKESFWANYQQRGVRLVRVCIRGSCSKNIPTKEIAMDIFTSAVQTAVEVNKHSLTKCLFCGSRAKNFDIPGHHMWGCPRDALEKLLEGSNGYR